MPLDTFRDAAEDARPDGLPAWRAFGSRPEHLDVDLGLHDPPRAVTRVLAACSPTVGETDAWELPVSTRVAALLAIVKATRGGDSLEATTVCGRASCGKHSSVALPLDALTALAGRPDDLLTVEDDDAGTLRFRRARGSDQRRWREAGLAVDARAFGTMIRDLAVDRFEGPLTADCLERIGEAFEEFDPLAGLRVQLACPYCGTEGRAPVDLQGLCLAELQRVRSRLLREVHAFARAYGWSEEATLALSEERRRAYLRLIEEDGR